MLLLERTQARQSYFYYVNIINLISERNLFLCDRLQCMVNVKAAAL
jgi:hypothetical protein